MKQALVLLLMIAAFWMVMFVGSGKLSKPPAHQGSMLGYGGSWDQQTLHRLEGAGPRCPDIIYDAPGGNLRLCP